MAPFGAGAEYDWPMKQSADPDLTRDRPILLIGGVLAALLLWGAPPARAQEPPSQSTPPATAPESPAAPDSGAAPPSGPSEQSVDQPPDSKNRIFGVMPNYTTVEGSGQVEPITSGQSFK